MPKGDGSAGSGGFLWRSYLLFLGTSCDSGGSGNALSISKQPFEVLAVVEALKEVYSSPEEVEAS